jgi:hypothetical protein
MAHDLERVRGNRDRARAKVFLGDARDCPAVSREMASAVFDFVVTSPPYPTEHDYTRNTRLELAFLEAVVDRASLRVLKRRMLRSHTKGIYCTDRDCDEVLNLASVQRIVAELTPICSGRTDGFSQLYPKVVQEYFGGMLRHFRSLAGMLAQGAKCAYVVGDQSSYLGVHIPTARVLADLAEAAGFRVLGIERWRVRRSTASSRTIDENVLTMQWP